MGSNERCSSWGRSSVPGAQSSRVVTYHQSSKKYVVSRPRYWTQVPAPTASTPKTAVGSPNLDSFSRADAIMRGTRSRCSFVAATDADDLVAPNESDLLRAGDRSALPLVTVTG